MEILTITISSIALLISAITAWLTLFHKGTVRMTRPTVIFFGPDGHRGPAKVFLRTLLYCTSRRGRIVESMFLKLRRSESSQIFNIWVYGDTHMSRGSGLFVGKEGVVCNHHFLLPKDGTEFKFLPGKYTVEAFAQLTEDNHTVLLSSQEVSLNDEWATKINSVDAGVFFDWGPDSKQYHAHLDRNPTAELNYEIQKKLTLKKSPYNQALHRTQSLSRLLR